MQSWLEGRIWVGKGAQATGMTASLRIQSSKADSNTWESFTRSGLKLESVCIKSHHAQTSLGKGLPSHFWTRDNVRSILPGLWRKRTGLLLSGPKSLISWGRRYRSIRARSTRLLNSFFPQAVRALNSDHPAPLWNPMQTPTSWNMDPPPPFFVQFKCATHRWVGLYKPPVAAHSPLCTRHFSYTIPQKTRQYMYVYMLMHYHKSFCTVPHLAAWLTMFLSAHVQYLCEAFA